MKTGLVGVRYSLMLFILPFTFAYFPEILTLGTYFQITYFTVCVVAGLTLFAAGMEGFLMLPLNALERILLMTSALLLFIPEGITDVTGMAISGAIIMMQVRKRRALSEIKTI